MSDRLGLIAASGLIPGRQSYFVEVPGARSATGLSVVSFEGIERMGEPYRLTIELTHPDDLQRADYLGKDAGFTLAPEGGEPRSFHGCITEFSKLKTTKDFCAYRFVIEAHVARLQLVRASRIFQHQSAPQIIEAILRRHGFKGHQFDFKLRRAYPEHAFHLQYQISDWDYIRVLMEQEGIYSYFVSGEHGDMLVFADDIDHYLYQPTLALPYRELAGLEANHEAILSLQTHTRTVPQSFLVADYNPAQAWERLKADANVASKDATTYGQPYVYGTGHQDQTQARWEAQLRHEAALADQVRYEGESTHPELRCARVVHTDDALPDAPNGMVVVEVVHTGARDLAYRNTFKAIPADRRFRLPLRETSWPKITGTLSARVSSPSKYKYAYLTKAGYYVVRFDLDFDEWNPGGESVPLRLAKPFAGKLQTGMHFPALDGDEAVIEFRDGDPDKPYIAAFHHHSQAVDLITNQDRWMSRNVIRTQSDNKLEMEDWEGQEHVKLSTEHSGKSQLTLGHIVNGKREKRGEGFELRSSGPGAVRALALLVTAEDQPNAGKHQLDREGARGALEQALQLSESLAEAARTAQAAAADYNRQKALFDSLIHQLRQGGILVSAPAGMAVASGSDLQLSADANLIATAGGHADISVLKRMTIAAGELYSVFVQKLGIKLFAARGKVEIQAQSDEMRLLSDKNMSITSANGRVIIEAKEELLFKCGGSYYRMTASGIEEGTRGDRTIKSASFSRQGPSSLSQHLNSLPQTAFNDPYVLRNKTTGELLKQHPYEIVREDGTRIKGLTDDAGRTSIQRSHDVERITIRALPKQQGPA